MEREVSWTIESATAWRLAALADGWTEEPTYVGQPVEQDSTLERGGFKVHLSARPPAREGLRPWAGVSVWGPDGLTIPAPEVYDFAEMERHLRICGECGKEGDTVRLGFANRVCPDCWTKLAPTVERQGWAE